MVSNGTWDPVSATPAFELLVTGVGDVAVRPMTMTAALAVSQRDEMLRSVCSTRIVLKTGNCSRRPVTGGRR